MERIDEMSKAELLEALHEEAHPMPKRTSVKNLREMLRCVEAKNTRFRSQMRILDKSPVW
jgi:hypothetical protein